MKIDAIKSWGLGQGLWLSQTSGQAKSQKEPCWKSRSSSHVHAPTNGYDGIYLDMRYVVSLKTNYGLIIFPFISLFLYIPDLLTMAFIVQWLPKLPQCLCV